ncbi:MAG: hypothetical protein JWR61_3394 [Ferruginibacter sp.]|nr:hypothetical protein [Ferruginibacter sp.]
MVAANKQPKAEVKFFFYNFCEKEGIILVLLKFTLIKISGKAISAG